ncbi:sperm-specific sodium:proton exchanger-like [Lissotriton helveticus]
MNTALHALVSIKLYGYEFSWFEGMLFGAVISTTDPILSAGSTKDIDATYLSILLGAEALFNDSTCFIVFDIFKDLLIISAVGEAGIEISIRIIMKFIASPLFGLLLAKIIMLWLSRVTNDETTEVSISLAIVYVSFFFAEWAGMSGVIVLSSFGLNLDIVAFTPGTEYLFNRFWKMLTFLSNTLIFAFVGYEIGEHVFAYFEPLDLFYIVVLYIGAFTIRLVVITMLSFWLRRMGNGFTWRAGVVVVWGGMRGAFTLNMALVAFNTDEVDIFMKGKLLLLVAGATIINLLINALSMRTILEGLGFCDVSSAKRMAMFSIIQRLRQSASTTLSMLKMDRFLADANWNMVETATLIEDPYHTSPKNATLEELFPELVENECVDCQKYVLPDPNPHEMGDMIDEARLRMLKAQVISYWRQYNSGILNRETTRILVGATETYIERKGKFMNIHEVKKCWEDKGIFVALRRRVETWVYTRVKEEIVKPSQIRALKICYRIVCTNEFDFVIYVSILMNIFPVVLYFIQDLKEIYEDELQSVNVFFMIFYTVETGMKILALRKFYFRNHWNKFDFGVLIIGAAEMLTEWLLVMMGVARNPIIKSILKALRLLRLIRALRLIKVLMPHLIEILSKQINKQLSCGYDIAKGFVISEEDIKNVVDQISDNKRITQRLKNVVEKDRQDGMQELGLLQRDNPEIVTAAKTAQAIRTVVNCIKETLQGLKAGGIVDQFQGDKLNKIIKGKLQQLASFPTTIPAAEAEELLRNVPWLEKAKAITAFIKGKAKILFFDYEDTICKQGDPPRGIHLIVSGLVKLYGSNPHFGHQHTKEQEEEDERSYGVQFTDYRGVGTLLGEVNCLTRQVMEVSIICDSAVQTCFIAINDLYEAFELFSDDPSLMYKIWLTLAIRTALLIFKETLEYQSWTVNKLYSWLVDAHLEDVELNKKLDVYDGTMEDVILVYGSLKDCQLLVPYYAPCVIPRTSHQVQGTAEITKLLIVPNVTMTNITRNPMLKDCSGPLCLQHAAAHRRARTGKTSIAIAVNESLTMLRTVESFAVEETENETDSRKGSVVPT